MVTTFVDITERKQADALIARQVAELQQANTMKDQFLGILSHELRTPINAIMGFGSILEDELVGPLNAEQRQYAQSVMTATDALLYLVNDLLDMSRIQAGKFTIGPIRIALAEVVEAVLANLAPAASNAQVTLRNQVVAELPIVMADEQRVAQVLSNMIGNAIKFTQAGGWVEVRAKVEGDALRCEVKDNGPGIAAGDHETLFDAFTQLDMSNTRRTGGVGLGLTICKSLVEAHGGTIGVDSLAGKGCTFWFTLPRAVTVEA